MKTYLTIQHTQSEQHTNGMIGSWTNWDLTPQGALHATRIAQGLSHELRAQKWVIYSSDLLRAERVAHILGEHLDTTPIYTQALREYNLGEAIGKSKQWSRENARTRGFPEYLSPDDRPFVGAESPREVWDRLRLFFEQAANCGADNIIVVSHSGTLRLLYAMWLGFEVDCVGRCELKSSAGGISLLKQDIYGRHTITTLNRQSYFSE